MDVLNFAEQAGPAFEEFQEMIGQRIGLKGFEKYRGGLDCRSESSQLEILEQRALNSKVMSCSTKVGVCLVEILSSST